MEPDTVTGPAEPLLIRRPPSPRRGPGLPLLRLLCAVLAVTTVVLAAALPALTARTGHFTRSEVPVWVEPVDGWGCHLLGDCRDSNLRTPGPGSDQLLHAATGRTVLVECALGDFYKISRPLPGWVPAPTVHTTADPLGCHAGEF